MERWLLAALGTCSLGEDVEAYALSRGASEKQISDLGLVEWTAPTVQAPDPDFRERYGSCGEKLNGRLAYPFWSPSGNLLGIEARSITEKRITSYRLPRSEWNPAWLGINTVMGAIWDGADIWIVEGLFDLIALRRIILPGQIVLSSMKAGLSKSHVEFLSRFSKGLVWVAYDNDETGRHMTHGYLDPEKGIYRKGALQRLKEAGVRVSDFLYVGGKDPGEIWSKGGDPALRRAFRME